MYHLFQFLSEQYISVNYWCLTVNYRYLEAFHFAKLKSYTHKHQLPSSPFLSL